MDLLELRAYLVSSLLDGLANFGIHAVSDIDDRGSFLEDTEGFDEWFR